MIDILNGDNGDIVVYTAKLLMDRRFTMGTPGKAWRTMVADWTKLNPERIIEDIVRFRYVIDKIIAVDDVHVSRQDLCNGHRQVMRRLV